ncbi:uncharacterized protein [Dysidea avara]|uniref:uncharacterized protein n=1 Tax=Dysidea avara TaxID=196820 RepID=UPI003317178C
MKKVLKEKITQGITTLRNCRHENSEVEKPKATPLPKRKAVVICLVNFSNQFGSLVIFPFLPFMISDFFPHLDRTEIGKKAGFLGSAYYIGSFAGSLMWGWLADVIGRRPAMLMGLCGTIFSITLFGFSQNFAWAVCTRLMWGLLNGNIGVVKTYMSEICDDTNQAKGFALIAGTAVLGRILGSVTGGFLARPASKYPLFDVPFFCQFPYVLPCMVALTMAISGLIAAWIFLDETLHKSTVKNKRAKMNVSNPIGYSMVTMNGDITENETNGDVTESETDIDGDMEPLMPGSHDLCEDHMIQPTRRTRAYQMLYDRTCCCHDCCDLNSKSFRLSKQDLYKARNKLVTMAKLMMDRRVLLATSLYGLLGFDVIIINELFPLLMVTDHSNGGYNMDDSTLGVFITIGASFSFFYQVLVYPRFTKLLGYRNSFRFGVVMFCIACVLLPLANQISGPVETSQSNNSSDLITINNTLLDMMEYSGSGISLDNNLTNDTCHYSRLESSVGRNSIGRIPFRVWLTVSMIMIIMVIGRLTSFTSVFVLVGNSALPATRGTVNGIGQSLVAIGRSTGPLIGAPLFAWSEGNGHGWPLNHHFMFDLTTLIAIFIILISFGLPKSSEKKRIPDQPDDQHINSDQDNINLDQSDIFNLEQTNIDIDEDINIDQDNISTDQDNQFKSK